MLRAWALTVYSERYSRAAISRFVSPAAMCWSTSISRSLRSSLAVRRWAGLLRAAGKAANNRLALSGATPREAASCEQAGHRRALIHEDPDVALRFGQGQGTLQRREGRGRVALRLVGERLQRQDLDRAPHPAALFRRMQEALQQSHGVLRTAPSTWLALDTGR